ncbi:MAG: glycoside hydrolase family 2 protein [Eubacteriales bacterium]|nr:glycoside hydrolase family 2 protein [Eubacteriales bacterium]
MIRTSLNGAWQMQIAGEDRIYAAQVPGSVYADLLRCGAMEDPFYRDNETKALALMDHDFIYRREFTLTREQLCCDSLLLRCEGLDTLAALALNGALLGEADNMHRTWEFDMSELAREGVNTLEIRFASPTRFIAQADRQCKADGSSDAMVGFPHLRKAHCMFGWDWGPHLPDAGIWRDISVVAFNTARIDGVLITQKHEAGRVTLMLDTEIELSGTDTEDLALQSFVTTPDGALITGEDAEHIVIDDPRLWWPHGYGDQPLYTLTVELYAGDVLLDTYTRRIGLRTMTMHIEKDQWGESFAHEVNGVQIFAMGADYIPEDNILSRVTPQHTRALLQDCIAANMNAVRVWGGGYYPDDFFYDICDELGLVVWQDMMFACAVYELTPDFAQNIRQELIDNVKRLRHHASLGLWCGNNEMEMFVDQWTWVSSHKQKADYIRMYEYLFPEVLREYDPNTFYWPASPSSGGGFDNPNDPNRGDVHYWEVWHGNKPFPDYRNHFFRYASEFGFQSFPCMKTIEAFTAPEDRNVFSYVMEKHQRNNAANGKIMNYLYQTFLYPGDLDTLVYASQLLQAEAIKYGVEHWRRNRGRCMGAIYWQLNDCWPVASWASIDYYGRWKALHYYAKRFFAPVMLSCCEEGVLTQNTNVNAQPFDLKKSIRLSVANETMDTFCGRVVWSLRNPDGSVVRGGEQEVSVAPLSSLWLEEESCADAQTYAQYVSYQLYDRDGALMSSSGVLFCPPKHFAFADPKLSVCREGDEVVVAAQAFARSIEVASPDCELLLADNYFDMDGGERRIRILRGDPKQLTVRSVYNIR